MTPSYILLLATAVALFFVRLAQLASRRERQDTAAKRRQRARLRQSLLNRRS